MRNKEELTAAWKEELTAAWKEELTDPTSRAVVLGELVVRCIASSVVEGLLGSFYDPGELSLPNVERTICI